MMFVASPAFATKSDDTIRFGVSQVLEHADPYFSQAVIASIVADHVWDGLVYRDPRTGEYRGNLATAWRWIDDRTLEFDLRQGVRFHDGEAFDADDVVYTFNFIANPANKAVYVSLIRWLDHAEKVGRYQVRVFAKEPFPGAIALLANSLFVIHPNEYYARVGPEGMNRRPIGTGPYRVMEYVPGKRVSMERYDEYFAGGPKPPATIRRVEIRFIPDAQTRVAAVYTGGLDLTMGIGRDQAQELRGEQHLQVLEGESTYVNFLQLNTLPGSPAPQLQDLRVRQAILHAINREAIVRFLVGERARVIHVPCHPTQFGCSDSGVPRYDYDPDRARQLLAEAGFPDGFDIDFFASYQRNESEAIVNDLRAVGIRARLHFQQYAAIRSKARANRVAVWHNVWATVVADASASVSPFFEYSADDLTHDPEIRDLLLRGDSAMDSADRQSAYSQALRLVGERAYVVPLYTSPQFYVAGRDLGFEPAPDGRPRFYEMAWR